MKRIILAACFASCAAMLPLSAVAQDSGAGGASMAEMAQKSNNPMSDVWMLLIQNDTS